MSKGLKIAQSKQGSENAHALILTDSRRIGRDSKTGPPRQQKVCFIRPSFPSKKMLQQKRTHQPNLMKMSL